MYLPYLIAFSVFSLLHSYSHIHIDFLAVYHNVFCFLTLHHTYCTYILYLHIALFICA